MALNRRDFLRGMLGAGCSALLGLPAVSSVSAMGDASRFRAALLQHPGDWDVRSSALPTLLALLQSRTSVEVSFDPVDVHPRQDTLFNYPFLWMCGSQGFDKLPARGIENLRRHLRFGGTLFVDGASSADGSPFLSDVRRELGRIFPARNLKPLPDGHAVYRSYYHLSGPAGRVSGAKDLTAISIDDRAAAIVSRNDLSGALARNEAGGWLLPLESPRRDERELSLRLAVNLAVYALTVNYKLDQVHISYQLRNPGRYPDAGPSSVDPDQR